MIIRSIFTLIALLAGGWMIFDGVHVLLTGKYVGPEKPGVWSNVVSAVGIDPFSMGVSFIIFGIPVQREL